MSGTITTTSDHMFDAAIWSKAMLDSYKKNISKGIFTVYDEYPVYTGGTKLLRDFAQLSNEYLGKKDISQRGWKTRRELRNV